MKFIWNYTRIPTLLDFFENVTCSSSNSFSRSFFISSSGRLGVSPEFRSRILSRDFLPMHPGVPLRVPLKIPPRVLLRIILEISQEMLSEVPLRIPSGIFMSENSSRSYSEFHLRCSCRNIHRSSFKDSTESSFGNSFLICFLIIASEVPSIIYPEFLLWVFLGIDSVVSLGISSESPLKDLRYFRKFLGKRNPEYSNNSSKRSSEDSFRWTSGYAFLNSSENFTSVSLNREFLKSFQNTSRNFLRIA